MFNKKGDFFKKGKCPECGHHHFHLGPNNGVAYNIKCKKCGTYLLVVPATKKVEIINPEHKW